MPFAEKLSKKLKANEYFTLKKSAQSVLKPRDAGAFVFGKRTMSLDAHALGKRRHLGATSG